MTPPEASVPVILEKTAARRMVWVDVARVAACILIIANHMAFYSAELVSSSSVPGVGTGCGRSDRLVPPARILRVLPAYV